MILYRAIKYTILDYCLNYVFNAFKSNLLDKPEEITDLTELYEGMKLRRIECNGYVWINCTITELFRFKNELNDQITRIEIKYDTVTDADNKETYPWDGWVAGFNIYDSDNTEVRLFR